MTKTIDNSTVKYIYKSLDTNDKFLNPIWMLGQNNPIHGCRVKISQDFKYKYKCISVSPKSALF